MSFNKLKKQRSNIADLAAKLETQGKKTYETDDRFWYPKRDENGNGYAIFRFLPAPGEEDAAYVQTFRHGYKGPNGWYIEECPTTIGEQCPVCTANSALYTDLGQEAASRIVSGQNGRKRKMQYVANIYVVSDPETPDNEGKVFLYKFGAKIFEKIKVAVSPEFPDETPIDPFDMWEGANFTLKIRKVDGNVNYDSSLFGVSEALLDNDKDLEKIYNSEYSLADLIAPDKYKKHEDLLKRFNQVSGVDEQSGSVAEPAATRSADTAEPKGSHVTELPEAESGEDKETLAFFEGLVEEG